MNASGGADSGSNRVNRGGGWIDNADFCTVSYRFYDGPFSRFHNLGFRLVRPSSK